MSEPYEDRDEFDRELDYHQADKEADRLDRCLVCFQAWPCWSARLLPELTRLRENQTGLLDQLHGAEIENDRLCEIECVYDEIDWSSARRVEIDPLCQAAQGHSFPVPPLGDRPAGIDDEAWDYLNDATERTLGIEEARYLVDEIAGLRDAINGANREIEYLREINERQRLRLRAVRQVVEDESGEIGNRPESHRRIGVVSSAHVRWALDASGSDLAELRRGPAEQTAA